MIEVYERYITNDEEEIEWYKSMGIKLPIDYDYRRIKIPIEDIMDVRQITERDSRIYFFSGWEMVVFGDADELFIRINDLKHNEMEEG